MSEEAITLTDATQQVSITWFDGTIDAVTVRPTWRDALAPEELGDAVVSLLENASQQTEAVPATAWEDSGPTDSTRDPMAALAVLQSLREIRQQLNRVAEVAVSTARERVDTWAPEPHNPATLNISVISDGPRLVALQFRRQWIEGASAAAISEGLTATLQRLQEDPPPVQESDANPLADEMATLRARLDGIAAEIGLHRTPNPKATA